MNPTVSVIVTVYNEEDNILQLLKALNQQSYTDFELVIVDAGSTDNTVQLITQYTTEASYEIQLNIRPGCNRSEGRNAAIRQANSSILAVTDAGCIPNTDWLEKITKGLRDSSQQVVAGFYTFPTSPPLQHCFGLFTSVLPEKLDKNNFLPSSRSIAFHIQAWEAVGGYPEELITCEDLIFASRLQTAFSIQVETAASVLWLQPKNLAAYQKQIAGYAYGAVQAKYEPHTKKIINVYIKYAIFLLLIAVSFIVFAVYLLYPILKYRKHIRSISYLYYLPRVQLATDMGILQGSIAAKLA